MDSEIPHHLLLVMVHSLEVDGGDPKLKSDILQHLLGMFGFYLSFLTKFVLRVSMDFSSSVDG